MIFILVDNCLPPTLAYALGGYYRTQSPQYELHALRDQFPTDISDIDWMNALTKKTQKCAFITNDRRIKKNKAEKAVLESRGLIGFCYSKGLTDMKMNLQFSQIFKLLPKIEDKIKYHNYSAGQMYELPAKGERLTVM